MADHVDFLCWSCYYQLGRYRKLSFSAVEALVHSAIQMCSYFHTCRSGDVQKSSAVIRPQCAAQLVVCYPPRGNLAKLSHVLDYVRDMLHWLPIEERIKLMILPGAVLIGRQCTCLHQEAFCSKSVESALCYSWRDPGAVLAYINLSLSCLLMSWTFFFQQ